MKDYVVISVEQDLLPDVLANILSFTTDANKVEVVHGPAGRLIHVDPLVADAWYRSIHPEEVVPPAPLPLPEPVAEPAAIEQIPEPPAVVPTAAVGPAVSASATGTVTPAAATPPLNKTARK